jgi:hypothetical protein
MNTIAIGVACDEVWNALKPCDAWGAFVYVHACTHEPGHKGWHLCPCGSRHRPDHPRDGAAMNCERSNVAYSSPSTGAAYTPDGRRLHTERVAA